MTKQVEVIVNDTPYYWPSLEAKTIDKKRFYITPEGNQYPSITTVLSPRNKEGIMRWRKKVGGDVATHIANKAAVRGSKVHKMCEDYLNGLDMEKHKKDFLPYCLFNELKNQTFDNINDVIGQELVLYSDKYKIAGRTDLIANYKGELSIVDFKTSTNERKDSYNENYYIQTSAYAEMFEELTGQPINQIVILVVTEDGIVQEFIKDKQEYIDELNRLLKQAINRQLVSDVELGSYLSGGMDSGIITAIAVFGITGVGAYEMYSYPVWCIEKGYARFAGKNDGSVEWEKRAKGWVKVMNFDVYFSSKVGISIISTKYIG